MATKDDIIKGLEVVIREARRVATDLTNDDWAQVVDLDGWKNREVLAHVAGVGGIVVPFVQGMANAAPGADTMGAIDIDALNAGMVAQRASASSDALAAEIEKNYAAVIEFVRGAQDDLLAKRASAAGYKDVPVSDLMMRMVVLHGLAHIYSVYASVFNAGR
jgi:hypothetical protein